jgi:hypothetical protein
MLRPGRIHIGSIKSCMTGFQFREESADTFLEFAIFRGCQAGRLPIDFSGPFRVIDISYIEMVFEHCGLHP